MIYGFLKILAQITMHFYFKSVEINGEENISANKQAIIIAPNHQNAFIDAIVLAVVMKRPIYFLARASVFNTIFNGFLRAINMRPVFRIRDGFESLSKNKEVFNECVNLLEDKNQLLLFPEADHGEEYYLRPLSRGLSRIAIQTLEESDVDLGILPVGINYTSHFSQGGKLFINYGKVIYPKNVIDPKSSIGQNLNVIREVVAGELKKQMFIPENDAHYLQKKSYVQQNALNKTFGEVKNDLCDSNVIAGIHTQNDRHFLKYLLLIPNLPFYGLTQWIIKKYVPEPLFHASIKFALMMLLGPIWLLLLFFVILGVWGLKWAVALTCIKIITAYLYNKV